MVAKTISIDIYTFHILVYFIRVLFVFYNMVLVLRLVFKFLIYRKILIIFYFLHRVVLVAVTRICEVVDLLAAGIALFMN